MLMDLYQQRINMYACFISFTYGLKSLKDKKTNQDQQSHKRESDQRINTLPDQIQVYFMILSIACSATCHYYSEWAYK